MNAKLLRPLFIRLLVVSWLACAGAQAADSNPPDRMAYQGHLTDANGVPIGDSSPVNYDVVFRIYDSGSGTLHWSEKQTVTFDNGQFSVLLGEGGKYSSEPHGTLQDVFASDTASDRYIGLTVLGLVSGDAEMRPRMQLVTSPFSFLARSASQLVGSDGSVLVGSTVDGNVGIGTTNASAKLDVNGQVKAASFSGSGAAITDIDAAKITTGTLSAARIANDSLSASKIDTGSGPFAASLIPNLSANKITTGTLSAARIANDSLSASKIDTGSGPFAASLIPDLNANKINAGTLDNARLSGKVPLKDEDNTFTGINNFGLVGLSGVTAKVGEPGTVGGSGYYFSGDGNTGMFKRSGASFDDTVSLYAGGNERLRVTTTGLSAFGTASGFSSRRYKTNLVEFKDDFSRILQARPVSFSWTNSPASRDLGYIAEEFHDLGLTNLVAYDAQGRPDGLHYTEITIYLNEVLKDQHREIAEFKAANARQAAQLASQSEELSDVKKRLAALEKLVLETAAARGNDGPGSSSLQASANLQ